MPQNCGAEYQRLTRYSRETLSGRGLDWSNKPNPYKTYPQARQIPLSRELVLPKVEARLALKGRPSRPKQALSLEVLAKLLFMSYGFTSQVDYGAEVFLYRSAPSAGALYPVEIYVAARDIDGLPDGLYHYSLLDFALTQLRQGPPPAGLAAPAVIITAMFFRSAWKYRDRAFRYCLLDSGHVAANLELCASALGLENKFYADFDDDLVNTWLGLDAGKETALALIGLGPASTATADRLEISADGLPQAEPTAGREEVFGLLVQTARLTSARLSGAYETLPSPPGDRRSLNAADWSGFQGPSLVQALQQRRSRRNFRPHSLTQAELAGVLELSAARDAGRLVETCFLASEVTDLPDGFYLFRPGEPELLLRQGGFLGPALAAASLDQEWVGLANVIFVLTAPLELLERQLGPRALRLASLAAGMIGQRAYLAAETLGWGCCGVGAFFDEEVRSALGLPPDEHPLYILPLGPIKKRTHGGRPTQR